MDGRGDVATPVAVQGAHSPVDADGAQVEDAGGAHHHVERDEDVTVEPAEEPGAADHLRSKTADVNNAHVSSPLGRNAPCSVKSQLSARTRENTWAQHPGLGQR